MTTTSTVASIASEEVTSSPTSAYSRENSMEDSDHGKCGQFESSQTNRYNCPVASESEMSGASAPTVDVSEEKPLHKRILLKRLPTNMSLASDSEEEPGMAEKLSSRNSAPSFEDLKMNTVSGCKGIYHEEGFYGLFFNCYVFFFLDSRTLVLM